MEKYILKKTRKLAKDLVEIRNKWGIESDCYKCNLFNLNCEIDYLNSISGEQYILTNNYTIEKNNEGN